MLQKTDVPSEEPRCSEEGGVRSGGTNSTTASGMIGGDESESLSEEGCGTNMPPDPTLLAKNDSEIFVYSCHIALDAVAQSADIWTARALLELVGTVLPLQFQQRPREHLDGEAVVGICILHQKRKTSHLSMILTASSNRATGAEHSCNCPKKFPVQTDRIFLSDGTPLRRSVYRHPVFEQEPFWQGLFLLENAEAWQQWIVLKRIVTPVEGSEDLLCGEDPPWVGSSSRPRIVVLCGAMVGGSCNPC